MVSLFLIFDLLCRIQEIFPFIHTINSISKGMPEDYCAKLLGTHWEGRFWASENKVFWTVKCIEYPEYNEVCVFVDGDRTEIPSMPVMGGKVSNKLTSDIPYS